MKKLDLEKPLMVRGYPDEEVVYVGRNDNHPRYPLRFAHKSPGGNWVSGDYTEEGTFYVSQTSPYDIINRPVERWVPVYALKSGRCNPYYGAAHESEQTAQEVADMHIRIYSDAVLVGIQRLEDPE